MSSNLTSVSINKNKSRFAPKVKSRPNSKRSQPNDASTSSSSSSSTAKLTDTTDRSSIATTALKALSESSIQSDKIQETLRQLSSSTIPSVANATELLSTNTNYTLETSHVASSTTSESSSSKRRPSKSGTPIVPGAPSKTNTTTTFNEPTNRNKRSATTISKLETPGTPNTPTPDPSGRSKNDNVKNQTTSSSSSGDKPATISLTKKQKMMKNIKDAMKKSDKTPSPISTPTPTKSTKPTSGNSFAAPSNTADSSIPTPTTTTSTTTTTATLRRRRVQTMISHVAGDDDDDNANFVVDHRDELDEESETEYTDLMMNAAERQKAKKKRKHGDESAARKKKKKEVLLAKDMKTLDDLTTDPLQQEDLDRDIKYFIKDLPKGVVTKQFRDEQIEREQEQLQRDEEAAALKNDQDALNRLAQQKLDLQQQKEKEEEAALVKKAEEEEKRKKQQQQQQQQNSSGLAESNHALQVRIDASGQIVLDTDSMMIDRNKERDQISHEHMEVVEENAQSRKVNSKTYGKSTGTKRWSPEETDLFYDLLSQFGTDFEMMAQMIPNRSRTQVRLKYNKEQKVNSDKVTEYMLRKKKPLDLEAFKNLTGVEFEKVPDHFHTLQIV